MKWKTKSGPLFVSVLAVSACGCANTFFGFGDLLGEASGGIDQIEECVTPLEPFDLNDVFARATPVQWNGESVELTDAVQPEVADFYGEHLRADVYPAYFLNERVYLLGPLAAGDLLEVEPLSDLVSHVWLYDAEFVFGGGRTHDLDGHRRRLRFPIKRDSPASFVRLNFYYLSKTGQPIVRLTRKRQPESVAPGRQTVVLNFSGQEEVTFRSGVIKPTNMGALDNPLVRERALGTFRETFAQFNLTVLTDEDPAPQAPYSVIHIGPASPGLDHLGHAEIIDYPNAVLDDVAIVDTNNQALQAARLLGPEAFGAAVGKVAAHEMGHLLGLVHVSDPQALMTGAGCQGVGLDPLSMLERKFKTGPVSSFTDNFSMGYQDAEQYLLEILGPAEGLAP